MLGKEETEPPFPFLELPKDIIITILQYLTNSSDLKTFLSLSANKRLREVVEQKDDIQIQLEEFTSYQVEAMLTCQLKREEVLGFPLNEAYLELLKKGESFSSISKLSEAKAEGLAAGFSREEVEAPWFTKKHVDLVKPRSDSHMPAFTPPPSTSYKKEQVCGLSALKLYLLEAGTIKLKLSHML